MVNNQFHVHHPPQDLHCTCVLVQRPIQFNPSQAGSPHWHATHRGGSPGWRRRTGANYPCCLSACGLNWYPSNCSIPGHHNGLYRPGKQYIFISSAPGPLNGSPPQLNIPPFDHHKDSILNSPLHSRMSILSTHPPTHHWAKFIIRYLQYKCSPFWGFMHCLIRQFMAPATHREHHLGSGRWSLV